MGLLGVAARPVRIPGMNVGIALSVLDLFAGSPAEHASLRGNYAKRREAAVRLKHGVAV